jgi:putative peptidoglycan lipid II flippase
LLVAQVVRNWFDYWFASGMGEGYAASLGYARGLSDTIVVLMASAVGTVIYPYFSDMATGDRKEESRDALMGTLRMMTFVFVPLSVAIIVVRQPLIQVIFERGKFTAESVGLTTAPFAFYTAGLTAFALEIILMQFYFSRRDTLTPIIVGIFCFVVHVGIVLEWKETMLHSSMAMGLSISKTIKVGILCGLLRYKLPALRAKENMFFLGKMLMVGLGMAAAMYGVQEALTHLTPLPSASGHFHKLVFLGTQMAVVGAVGGLVFTALAFAIRIREASMILEFCRRRIVRGRQKSNSGNI